MTLIQVLKINPLLPSVITSSPPASGTPTLTLGTSYQNTLGYDILLVVYLNVTAYPGGSPHEVLVGVSASSTPGEQAVTSGTSPTGFLPVTMYVPNNYYAVIALLNVTASIIGQQYFPI